MWNYANDAKKYALAHQINANDALFFSFALFVCFSSVQSTNTRNIQIQTKLKKPKHFYMSAG